MEPDIIAIFRTLVLTKAPLMNARFFYLLAILLGCSLQLAAQATFMFDDNQNRSLAFRFEAIGAEQGLPHKTVQELFQDHLGFIWLGTPIGLVKYDGYRFETYQYQVQDSISGVVQSMPINVSTIIEDPYGDLWVGCIFERPGKPILFHFDREMETFTPYELQEEPPRRNDLIKSIHASHEFIWVNTPFLYRLKHPNSILDKQTGKRLVAELLEGGTRGLKYDRFANPYEDSKGRIWIPTFRGIQEWIPESDTFRFYPAPAITDSRQDEDYVIAFMAESKDDWFWVFPQVWGQLMRFHPDVGRYEVISMDRFSGGIRMLRTISGQLWFGKRAGNGGIEVLDLTTQRNGLLNFQVDGLAFFPQARVLSMMQDRSGNIWVGTEYGPLLKYGPQRNQFHWLHHEAGNPHSLSHNSVTGIQQDKSGQYWISTYGGGLNRWNRRENTFTHFRAGTGDDNGPVSDFQLGVGTTDDGKIWFGEGFMTGSLDPSSGVFRHYQTERGTCWFFLRDSGNGLWLTKDSGGLRRYDPATDQFISINISDPADSIQLFYFRPRSIFQDSRGHLWIETFESPNSGFVCYDPDTEEKQIFNLPDAKSFCEDQRGYVWIGTIDGLYRYDSSSGDFKRYGEEDGLPNNIVESILEDDAGRLWLGTDNGLSRFEPEIESFRNYFQSDGLPANEFNQVSYKNERGELFFAGNFGLLYFHPDSIQDNTLPPQLAFTGIDLFGEPLRAGPQETLSKHISVTERIDFSHLENDLTIHYAALHFKNPEKNRYRIRLDNDDDDWRDAGYQNFATYTNLDPGRYTFRVQAANSDGIWNEEGIALDIVIHPPWYWTWWSQALYLLLITSLILGGYRFQLNRRLTLAEATRLRELDEVKTKLYTNITHEFRTPLTVIQGVAEQIRDHAEEKELIHRNSRQLLDLVNKMLDLSKIEAGKLHLQLIHADILSFLRYITESFHSLALNQKINLNFYADLETLEMDYDPEKILQILSNLVSNAIKFTPEYGKIQVTAQQKEDGIPLLILKVKDTGTGIAPEELPHIFDRFYQVDASNTRRAEGTGIGLALTKELVELMEGRIEVESQRGEGTVFTVILPIEHKPGVESQVSSVALAQIVPAELEQTPPDIPLYIPNETHPTNKRISEPIKDLQLPNPRLPDAPTLLIVEDNRDVRQYLAAYLQKAYKLSFARNGREGIDQALETVPDIIISDIMMPEVDGFELCQTLKQDERTSHIPIILLTAKADMDAKLEGLEYGADAYLAKPFHQKELDIRLRKLIEGRRKLQAKYRQADFETEPATEREDSFVLKVRQLVMDHLDDPNFSVEELAKALFLSRTQVHRKLKALTGLSTAIYIRHIRLNKAKELLKNTDLNISEIAYDVGFSSPNYFANMFKEEMGITPSVYREGIPPFRKSN